MARDAHGADRQLAVVLAGARLACVLTAAIGAVAFGIALLYEGLVLHAVPNLYVIALGVVPAALGLHMVVRAALRAGALRRLTRRPDTVELVELAMRWGQPALRVTFADGASETFSTGRADRNQLIDAIRRRAIARVAPGARVVRR